MNHLQLTLLSAAALALCLSPAHADTNSVIGNGNVTTSNSSTTNSVNNSGVGNGNTTVNTNSNNPALTATGGAGGNATGGSSRADSLNVNSNAARQGQRQSQSADNAGNAQSVNQTYRAQDRNPVSTAFAAPLVASGDCAGSTSAGAQGVGFGLSLGSTWDNENCERRHDAAMLSNMGYKPAAAALMCQSERVALAMQAAGTPCPAAPSTPTTAAPAPRAHADDATAYDYPTSAKRSRW